MIATTSVHTRGTVHLTSDATDADGRIVLDKDSTTAVVLDESATTALDVQRETLVRDTDKPDGNATHRRDQSLIRISSGGDVDFQGQSLTLATGGQVLVDAAGRSTVADGARIDVSGAVGVRIAMEANNVLINVQGNEQRDASGNRDDKSLNNSNIWLDRRDLVLVPAGTNGYETDRWYTAGGLLEVGGYLGVTGHGIGEWSAQGGTVQFSGGEVVTRQGSHINLSGGTLDVQTGWVNQTFLKGADGKLYNASNAPGDLLYTGLYKGFEDLHERWGSQTTSYYYNPLIAPRTRLEGGYVVGRDAGKLVVATRGAVLEGDVEGTTFQGDRQQRARDATLDGYQQAQTAAARGASLIIGSHRPVYDKDTGDLRYSPDAVVSAVTIGDAVPGAEPEAGRIALDADWLNRQGLGGAGGLCARWRARGRSRDGVAGRRNRAARQPGGRQCGPDRAQRQHPPGQHRHPENHQRRRQMAGHRDQRGHAGGPSAPGEPGRWRHPGCAWCLEQPAARRQRHRRPAVRGRRQRVVAQRRQRDPGQGQPDRRVLGRDPRRG